MGMGGGNINYVQMQVVKVSWICYPTAIYILTISNWKSFFVFGPLSFCFCVNYLTIYFFFLLFFLLCIQVVEFQSCLGVLLSLILVWLVCSLFS